MARPKPSPAGAYEVLRALVLGLALQETSAGWAFVGPWQPPDRSAVAPVIMRALLKNGFVERGEVGAIGITALGRDALGRSTSSAIRETLKWLRSE